MTPQSQALELLRDIEMETRPGGQWTLAEVNEACKNLLSAQKDEAGPQGERRVLKDRRNPQDGDRNAPYRRMGPRRSTDKPAPVQPAAHKGEKG